MTENKIRYIDGNAIPTKKKTIWLANGLVVEVGTNGYKGGDSGHGSRTILRLYDIGGTDIRFNKLVSNADLGANGGIQIVVGGDSELQTIIESLEFAVKTLKEQSNYDDNNIALKQLD